MKLYRHLFPISVFTLVALFLGASIHATTAFAQDGSSPTNSENVAGVPDAVNIEVNTTFTYQGNLRKNGQPVTANCSFQFSLWDAATEGEQKATTQIVNNTQVQDGSFTIQLDFGNQFTGAARWLQTAVQCAGEGGYTTLSPRQSLNAVPYAIGLRPGAVMQSAAPGDAFYVEKNAADSVAIHGKATQEKGTGVLGESATWAGVWGESTSASGVVGMSAGEFSAGVWGENTGQGFGVYGKSPDSAGVVGESTNWIGVYGKSTSQTGVVGESTGDHGVRGSTAAANRAGVRGIATGANSSGVWGESALWAGVWGQSAGASGVVGVSAGEFNGGVYGVNTGEGYGVYGKAPNSAGVFGESTAWIGVYGKSASQTGVVGESDSHDGVRGTATAANRIGVKGVANATGSVGVWGESAANTGVYGQSGAADGAALWGKNTAGGIALKAEGNAVQSLDMNGLPKAMALIKDGVVVRCYNGMTGNSFAGDGCGGFNTTSIPAEIPDKILVDFGFAVSDRFILVNAFDAGGTDRISRFLYIEEINGSTVTVHNQRLICSSGFCGGIRQMDFFIFVF